MNNQPLKLSHKIILIIIVILLLFLKKPHSFIYPQFWAEDGTIFFSQNLKFGIHSFIIPYAGYLHFAPRFIAFFASYFPIILAPIIYNFFALVCFLLVCFKILSSRVEIPVKPLFVLSLILVPNNGLGEIMLNTTNVQWFLAIILVLLAIQKKPENTFQTVADFLILFILSFTGVFIVLALPIFIYKFISEKSNYNLALMLLGVIFSIFHIILVWKMHGSQTYNIMDLVPGFKVFINNFFSLDFMLHHLHHFFLLIVSGLLFLYMACKMLPKNRLERTWIAYFLYFGIAVIIGGALKTCLDWHKFDIIVTFFKPLFSLRYSYIFCVMFIWSLLLCGNSKGFRKNIAYMLVFVLFLKAFLPLKSGHDNSMVDYNWYQLAYSVESKNLKKIPINPPGWFIDLN